ncbi:MAG: hypothetical protein OXG60_14000 [Chloroflexi bacterium]|nr:hypothetical protein [Chloroflexota bacterium]
MQATYTLDTRIKALNLLDQLDGDFQRVKERLKIPLETLRGWRSSEREIRRRFEDREYRHFASIKLELLRDMLETSRDIMKIIKSGEHKGVTLSQLAYTLSTLLNQAHRLEESFEDLPPDAQLETEQPNRMRFIYEDDLPDPPPPAATSPEMPGASQSMGVRERLRQIGVWADPEPEVGPPGAEALLADLPLQSDGGGGDPARSGKGGQTAKKRRPKPKQKARQSAKRRRNRQR